MASSPKPPKPVDPNLAAEAQARWNRTGQITPFGSVEWDGNNQVSTPSDSMMALFNQAQGIASGGATNYEAPSNFGSIRDQTMARLQGNAYQPGSKPAAKYPNKDEAPQMMAKGTPIRDAFFGEKDPETGERRTIRHFATGGLAGAIPRAVFNMVDERRGRNQMPGQVGMSQPGNSPIGSIGIGPLFEAPPSRSSGPMPGRVAIDKPGVSPIQRNDIGDSKPRAVMSPTRRLGRKPTARERAQMRNDPNSLLYSQASNMPQAFTSQTRGIYDQYDLNNSPGGAFDSAVAAYARMLQPNRNSQH